MLKKFYIKKEFFVQTSDQQLEDCYKFVEPPIGRGSFGVIYRAKMKYYPYLTRVIKKVSKSYVKNPTELLKEYNVLTSFDHPQIIKIYETFEDEKHFYMVIDYCEGGDLFTRLLSEGNFSEKEARTLFAQMVNIMKYCHDNRVAHRDLKPDNFLLVSHDTLDLMLIDFGLAFPWKKSMRKEVGEQEGRNNVKGTAYYIAPEVFQGDYDQRCDIWSLGIILFMLVTGEPPVQGRNEAEVLANIRKGRFNFGILERGTLSPSLVDLLKRIFKDEASRIKLRDIQSHPWMTSPIPSKKLNINFEKIRQYSKFSKFKVLTLNYIASQLPQREIMLLGKMFMEIDKNKDGFLTVEELSEYMSKQEEKQEFHDIREIIRCMDVDYNGKLAYNEFISACLSKSAANNRQYLTYAFRYFDVNHDGKLNYEELSVILKAYSREYAENTKLIDKLLEECDTNRDGSIDFEEFCRYIKKNNPDE